MQHIKGCCCYFQQGHFYLLPLHLTVDTSVSLPLSFSSLLSSARPAPRHDGVIILIKVWTRGGKFTHTCRNSWGPHRDKVVCSLVASAPHFAAGGFICMFVFVYCLLFASFAFGCCAHFFVEELMLRCVCSKFLLATCNHVCLRKCLVCHCWTAFELILGLLFCVRPTFTFFLYKYF